MACKCKRSLAKNAVSASSVPPPPPPAVPAVDDALAVRKARAAAHKERIQKRRGEAASTPDPVLKEGTKHRAQLRARIEQRREHQN